MSKLVTYIMPAYNAEKTIKKSIESVLNQTYKNIELIIFNDGSTDETLKIINQFKDDSRVKVISKSNRGVSACRNEGIKIANGEYVVFIDSDDFVDREMLKKMINSFDEDTDMVQCGYNVFDGANVCGSIKAKTNTYSKEKALQFYMDNLELCVVPWNKVIRKELAEKVQFPCGRRYEDEAIMYKLFYEAQKIKNLEDCYYYYYQNQDGFMLKEKESISKLYDFLQAKKDLFDYINNNSPELKKRIIKEWTRVVFFTYLKSINNKLKTNEDKEKYASIKEIYIENYNVIKQEKIAKKETIFLLRYFPMIFKLIKR